MLALQRSGSGSNASSSEPSERLGRFARGAPSSDADAESWRSRIHISEAPRPFEMWYAVVCV